MPKKFKSILNRIYELRGIDFSGYRQRTLSRRIEFRLAKLGINDNDEYLELLNNDPTECDELIDTIAINVSAFFRDPIVYEILAQRVIPDIIEKKRKSGMRQLRIWSAGCACGEEPYSLAMLIHKALKKDSSEWSIHIFATDIDKESLRRAEKANYPRERLLNTKLEIVSEYFECIESDYLVKPEIREMVHFSNDDLTSMKTFAPKESVFGEFDIIFCRNVLIYLNDELQRRVMDKFVHSLDSKGYLFLGDAEQLGAEVITHFQIVDRRNRIFKKCIT